MAVFVCASGMDIGRGAWVSRGFVFFAVAAVGVCVESAWVGFRGEYGRGMLAEIFVFHLLGICGLLAYFSRKAERRKGCVGLLQWRSMCVRCVRASACLGDDSSRGYIVKG